MNLTAALFSLFFLLLLHSAGAKASIGAQDEKMFSISSAHESSPHHASEQQAGFFLISGEDQFAFAKFGKAAFSRYVSTAISRDLYANCGLSPPQNYLFNLI